MVVGQVVTLRRTGERAVEPEKCDCSLRGWLFVGVGKGGGSGAPAIFTGSILYVVNYARYRSIFEAV